MTRCSTWPATSTSAQSSAARSNARMINTDFRYLKNGQYKIISFYAQKARGMSSFVIAERINHLVVYSSPLQVIVFIKV